VKISRYYHERLSRQGARTDKRAEEDFVTNCDEVKPVETIGKIVGRHPNTVSKITTIFQRGDREQLTVICNTKNAGKIRAILRPVRSIPEAIQGACRAPGEGFPRARGRKEQDMEPMKELKRAVADLKAAYRTGDHRRTSEQIGAVEYWTDQVKELVDGLSR